MKPLLLQAVNVCILTITEENNMCLKALFQVADSLGVRVFGGHYTKLTAFTYSTREALA